MLNQTLIPLKEAVAYLPARNGKKPHLLTVKRWIVDGLTDGHRKVYLLAEKIGGVWYTCERWIDDFKRDLTRSAMRPMPKPAEDRRGNHRKAKLELQRRYGFNGPKEKGSDETSGQEVPPAGMQPAGSR